MNVTRKHVLVVDITSFPVLRSCTGIILTAVGQNWRISFPPHLLRHSANRQHQNPSILLVGVTWRYTKPRNRRRPESDQEINLFCAAMCASRQHIWSTFRAPSVARIRKCEVYTPLTTPMWLPSSPGVDYDYHACKQDIMCMLSFVMPLGGFSTHVCRSTTNHSLV